MEQNPTSLILETVDNFVAGFFERLPQLGLAILVLVTTLIVARIIRSVTSSVMHRAGTRDALITLSKNLIGIAAWIVGSAIAVTVVFPSITPANLIAGLGLTSVAIGFAFKDVFENFLAGVIILAREKMRIGDYIECGDVFGAIETILIRETHIRETDGELVIVPNSYLFSNPLTIQTDQEVKRQELIIGVDYDASLEAARDALQEALSSAETIDRSHDTEVACIEFGGSSINFKLLWWADSQPKKQRQSYDEVAFAVKAALDDAGIGIPFPQQTLSFREEAQPISISRAGAGRQEKNGSESNGEAQSVS